MLSFIEEYKALYYRQMTTWLHFCQQSMHGLSHLAPDTVRLGLGGYSSQWTLERTIGNLGEEIKQPSKPYANLANCGLHHSQLSALHAVMPDLAPNTPALLWGAIELGDGYVLLRAQDKTGTVLEGESAGAICTFLLSESKHGELPMDWQPSAKQSIDQFSKYYITQGYLHRCQSVSFPLFIANVKGLCITVIGKFLLQNKVNQCLDATPKECLLEVVNELYNAYEEDLHKMEKANKK
ncbi:hypothetical protein EI94DRAFT_1704337 [Lactarius quietus]|nr:hypothetical protein EI94DRAFT_1704337 [Lactarius quietus]